MKSVYIKPTTVAGVIATNTLSSANDLWSKYLPYDSEVMENVFDEILEIRDITNQDQFVEAKQHALKEMKKYMNTVDADLYTENADKERYDLFIDRPKEKHQSLATYFNVLMKPTENPNITNFIHKNPLLIRLKDELDLNINGEPSLIKFNNAIGENFDEEILSNAILELLKQKIDLPDKNGKPYNTRLLAQDLINYALLEGGLQEAIQFVKHIPFSYLKETNFANTLASSNLNTKFGIVPEAIKNKNPHFVSKFAIQYAQHFPNLMPKIDKSLMSDVTLNKNKEIIKF